MFKKMFEAAGFKIQNVPTDYKNGNSFIADNGVVCVAATQFKGMTGSELAAVSFLSLDKDTVLSYFNKKNDKYKQLGFTMFSAFMNQKLPVFHFGNFCNHDYCPIEVESILKSLK